MDKLNNGSNSEEIGKNAPVEEKVKPDDKIETIDIEETIKKYDAELAFRTTQGITDKIVTLVAV